MGGKTRIPEGMAPFNAYINNSDDYLQALSADGVTKNWERLGLTIDMAAKWKDHRVEWRDNLYPVYSNPALRNKTTTKQVNDFRDEFKAIAGPMLNLMAASPNAGAEDEEMLNFVISRKKPTHSHTPITDTCFGRFSALGGGEIKVSFTSDTDTKRASLIKGANCVQIAFKIGDTPPAHVLDGTKLDLVPRASYIMDMGADNSGKKLFVYQRWYNSKYPELAGPWSGQQSLIIT